MPLAMPPGMKRTLLVVISLLVTAAPVVAQHGGGGSMKPKTPHVAPAPKTTTHVAPVNAAHGSGVHAASAPTKAPKTMKAPNTTKAPKTEKAPKAAKPAKTTASSRPTGTLTPVQQKLQRNTNLASKLQSRLPAGTNVSAAASGFRNLGQFVAAVNVSNNLRIPFAQLKNRMVDRGMSLGQAIQDVRPKTGDSPTVARRAETDADVMIRMTEQTTAAKSKKVKKNAGAH
jgi:hypothetical protein